MGQKTFELLETFKQTGHFVWRHKVSFFKFSLLPGILTFIAAVVGTLVLGKAGKESFSTLLPLLFLFTFAVYFLTSALFHTQAIQLTLSPKTPPALYRWTKLHWRMLGYSLLLWSLNSLALNAATSLVLFYLYARFSFYAIAIVKRISDPVSESWVISKENIGRLYLVWVLAFLLFLLFFVIVISFIGIVILLDLNIVGTVFIIGLITGGWSYLLILFSMFFHVMLTFIYQQLEPSDASDKSSTSS